MPLQIMRNDITTMAVDAIVNAANASLLGGGGVDGAIHAAAGPELMAACRTLHGCAPGNAKLTKGYRLPCKYVIHTVGPIWRGGGCQERETLISSYRSSLALAAQYGCETVAFPLISAGAYGYPKDQALRIAMDTIQDFLRDHDMTVYLVIYDKRSFQISRTVLTEIEEFVDQRYVDAHPSPSRPGQYGSASFHHAMQTEALREDLAESAAEDRADSPLDAADAEYRGLSATRRRIAQKSSGQSLSLADKLQHLDESFSQALLRMIDERGITDAACYKRANIDRKLFSKIRKDPYYKPSKPTAIAFAIALELDLKETEAFLRKAGYALSPSSKFDLIIEYFIQKRNYDIFAINEALFAFDQATLGV